MTPHQDRDDKGVLVVDLDDSINDDVTEEKIHELESNIERGLQSRLILNCSKVEFLSSYGLSVILRLRNVANRAHGEIKLCGLTDIVHKMLQVSKVDNLFLIYPNVEQAQVAFRILAP